MDALKMAEEMVVKMSGRARAFAVRHEGMQFKGLPVELMFQVVDGALSVGMASVDGEAEAVELLWPLLVLEGDVKAALVEFLGQ